MMVMTASGGGEMICHVKYIAFLHYITSVVYCVQVRVHYLILFNFSSFVVVTIANEH